MTQKTISTPDLFGGSSGDSSSRGVSEVVGTASLIVLALGLVGGVAVGLGGVTDGINNNGLEGDFEFNQDGSELTIVVNSLSDAATPVNATDGIDLAIQVEGEDDYASAGKAQVTSAQGPGAGSLEEGTNLDPTSRTGFVDQEAEVGSIYQINDGTGTSISEGDTVTITVFDGNGNGQVVAEFTYGSV